MNIPSITTSEVFSIYLRDDFWRVAAGTVCGRHRIVFNSMHRAENGENVVFLIDDKFVIKFFTPFKNGFAREIEALQFARGKTGFRLPEFLHTGEFENFNYIISTQLSGDSITRAQWLTFPKAEQIKVVRQLAAGLKELHSHHAPQTDFDWQNFVEHQIETTIERQKNSGATDDWLASLPEFLARNVKLLPSDSRTVFLHGDVHFGNLRFRKTAKGWRIVGLFDFADSLTGFHEYDFIAVGVLMIQGQADLQHEFFRAYGYADSELNETLRARMMLLTVLYEHSSLRRYAQRFSADAANFSLLELEKAIWNFV